MAQTSGGEGDIHPSHLTQSLALHPPTPEQRGTTGKQGIVIQLIGTEGESDSLEDNEFMFNLDHDPERSTIQRERPSLSNLQLNEDWGLRSPTFHVPVSPSSPGSLGDLSTSLPGFLSPGVTTPTHRPLMSLVKSLSTELELKEPSTLKPKPFLNLVKSISTELSLSEPEVSQSKSDSKLNLHLWTQFTQPKARNGDSRTAPPSPTNHSPTEPKATLFKMELEDTRRKLSEAMQEPLSMFSKIMREDSNGSPKYQKSTASADSPSFRGFCCNGAKSNVPLSVTDSLVREAKRLDCEGLPMCKWPVRQPKKCLQRPCLSQEQQYGLGGMGSMMNMDTQCALLQGVAEDDQKTFSRYNRTEQPPSPVPGMTLVCIATLSYSYFVLPLSSYWSGLFLGLAFGFMIGLLLILLGSTACAGRIHRYGDNLCGSIRAENVQNQPQMIKGWMNEMHAYDAETYHPALMHSVYVTLEGPCLRLDYPQSNICRWATFDEQPSETAYVHSSTYRLVGSKVFLLPLGLARKRVWNRKYPICITLAEEEEAAGQEEEPKEVQLETQTAENPTPPVFRTSLPTTLYLFGRTGREKEEWFHHLFCASEQKEEDKNDYTADIPVLPEESRVCPAQGGKPTSRWSYEDVACSPLWLGDAVSIAQQSSSQDSTSNVASLISPAQDSLLSGSCPSSAQGSPTDRTQHLGGYCDGSEPVWMNAFIGRIFWDFLREKYWADQVSHKIQRKLSKIRLPYFMNELTLTDLAMGSSMPRITGTSSPWISGQGLWIQLGIEYTGGLQMTLQTKMNLSKLGKENGLDTDSAQETGDVRTRSRLSVLADSDEESSSAGSSDEEETPSNELQGIMGDKATPPGAEGAVGGGRTGRRILRFVDKIAKSKYFQKATENEYIKKKIEEMSKTPLLLTVEIQELSGTLAINIPPPPTDRIWYGFCVPPRLDLRVRPKLGEREVTFFHVTEWIERKLQDEFQKVFVLPNMDDVYLPLLTSGMEHL